MRRYIAGAIAVALLLLLAYCRGVENGRSDEKLRQNGLAIAKQDSVAKQDSIKADSARRNSDALSRDHDLVRTKIKVVRDTVIVNDATVYVESTLAQVILSADSTIRAQQKSLALQDTLIASLRNGIALRDQRISLLEARKTPRISRGIQAGGGYCATPTGQTPCLYVGYGGQFRF